MPKVVAISASKRAEVLARRDALVEANMSLVEPIARYILRNCPPSFELDDLISAGYLGLLRAATSYRPKEHNDTPFSAYARPRIRGAILDSIRRANWTEATHAGEESIPETAVVVAIDEYIDQSRQSRRVRNAVSQLSERHQDVLEGYYGDDDLSLREVGEQMGVSSARAWQLRGEALRELRGSLVNA